MLSKVFVNESSQDGPALILTADLALCTVDYLLGRDRAELELILRIKQLESK